MSKATYIRFGAKNSKGVRVSPQTLTLATIVGEPLNFGGVIRLTDARQIEKLLGDGTKYFTQFEDGSVLKWFSDVTAEYADRERKVAKAEVVKTEPEEPEEPGEDEPAAEDEPGEDEPGEDEPAAEEPAAETAAPARPTVPKTRRK